MGVPAGGATPPAPGAPGSPAAVPAVAALPPAPGVPGAPVISDAGAALPAGLPAPGAPAGGAAGAGAPGAVPGSGAPAAAAAGNVAAPAPGLPGAPVAAEAGALQLGVVGFGAWQKLHFRQRRRVFTAVYSTGEQLVLRIGTFEVRWPDPDLRVSRSTVFAHVKRFRVHRADQLVLSFLYPYLDWDAFPDNGDILTYAESMTRTPNVTMRTILRFKVISTGIDPMSERYVEEVAAALQEADRRTGMES